MTPSGGGDPAISANFKVTIENVSTPYQFFQGGIANIPVDASEPAPLLPGEKYEISFNASQNILPDDGGSRLSFVAMFVQSNDLFFAPDESGIALYDGQGNPIGEGNPADVTSQVRLWDAGTEVNEVTGGPNQKPQQDATAGQMNAMNVGTAENGVITLIENNSDGVNTNLPAVSEVIKVLISHEGEGQFTASFENVSDDMTIAIPFSDPNERGPVPVSPLVWGVHTEAAPFFQRGEVAMDGIENIAEDGVVTIAALFINSNIGVTVPLSPGIWAVHDDGEEALFNLGQPDRGEGMEAIAEDGDPAEMAASLDGKEFIFRSGKFDTPEGASEPGPIGPGQRYSFTFQAQPGDRLSLATMFVQSNDWFYGFGENGINVFNINVPVTGEVTPAIRLYDAGTEKDQYPGAGPDQVIRQSALDTGARDNNSNVRTVENLPAIIPASPDRIIRITLSEE